MAYPCRWQERLCSPKSTKDNTATKAAGIAEAALWRSGFYTAQYDMIEVVFAA